MFKSKEELIKEDLRVMDECSDSDRDGSWNDGIEVGISDAFKSFAERVEFYKKYVHKPVSYVTDKQHNYKTIEQFFIGDVYDKMKAVVYNFNYNDSLFDYCFGDIND